MFNVSVRSVRVPLLERSRVWGSRKDDQDHGSLWWNIRWGFVELFRDNSIYTDNPVSIVTSMSTPSRTGV